MDMEKRWRSLWTRIGAVGDPEPAYRHLVMLYSEPHRQYHVLGHVQQCLDALAGFRDLTVDHDAVETALWFHDAIYATFEQEGDPVKKRGNELASATLAWLRLGHAGVGTAFCEKVERLILDGTSHDGAELDSTDLKIVSDIDLGILGQPEPVFDRYEEQIRREYEWVPEEAYRPGRIRILRGFLDRPYVYHTLRFRDRFEEQARANLRRSIEKLRK
jgi:predicted metal-dependent HD superfamily phosphohydrolase